MINEFSSDVQNYLHHVQLVLITTADVPTDSWVLVNMPLKTEQCNGKQWPSLSYFMFSKQDGNKTRTIKYQYSLWSHPFDDRTRNSDKDESEQ